MTTTRPLGTTGIEASIAGLGCNNFGMRIDQDSTNAVVAAALDAGVTFFDTAISYGGGRSETMLGIALGSRRDEVLIATKFGGSESDNGEMPKGSPEYIARAVDISLERLGTDHIDLYQQHMPDPSTPIAETLGALNDLVIAGKVRAIGCSNVSAAQIAEAAAVAAEHGYAAFVTVQNEWSLLARGIEGEVTAAAAAHGLGVLPYFPLASGLLTGKVARGAAPPSDSRLNAPYFASVLTDANFDKVEALADWAAAHRRTITEVALSWLASDPVVTSVIAGATSPAQVTANAAATKPDLTDQERAEIAALVA
jgi:aryl-alcohol dehydrogenase-like predicted oxidoreductase